MKKFKKYIKETWKNKAVALLLLILGIISMIINNLYYLQRKTELSKLRAFEIQRL